jgi:hypothetical protein
VATPVDCSTPPNSCYEAWGTCQEPTGTCSYAPLAAGTGICSDGDNCTVNDACDGDGGCAGTPITCTPPDQCLMHVGCTDGGSCRYAVAAGQPCDAGTPIAGTCSDAGVCVPSIFPFIPSNFTEAQLPMSSGALTFNCGTTTLDTGQAGETNLRWTNNCPGTAAPAFTEIALGTTQFGVLLFADSLSIAPSSTLAVTGERALLIAVRNDATIDGTLDVGSTPGRPGPAAGRNCGPSNGGNGGQGTGANNSSVAGGGGGGGFGTAGGAGAPGEGGAAAGKAGSAMTYSALVPLRGGCNGGNGGRKNSPNGDGGRGGGAVQLTVGGTLTIGAGRVAAYGERGHGGLNTGGNSNGSTRGGGGGGGSGGGVLLEAAIVRVGPSGAVTANGGGGGEAAGGSTGADGQDGNPALATVATGGSSATCGGNGGNGAAGSVGAQAGMPGDTCNNGKSGGGGGGGVGVIVIKASTSCTLTGVISPAAHGNGTTNGCPAP